MIIDFPKGAAPAASDTSSHLALRDISLTVANRHCGIILRSFDPFTDADSLNRTANCKALFDSILHTEQGRPMLRQYEPRDLIVDSAVMIEAGFEGHAIGTLYFHRDAGNNMLFKAVVVHPAFGGMKLATAMISVAILTDLVTNGPAQEYRCTIRELPEGLNEASRISFARLGFLLETETGKSQLKGNIHDRHRFASAEQDQNSPFFIRYRRMSAGPEAVPAARAFLAAWSEAILPFPHNI
ncbi:hypothetical protein [Rhizobium sp. RU36D]|uniref:hypothetical protein n=1 Tax=Rhizobium sp. RU36D TaxID=1907415 RepID=UPI0009D7DCB8|nr:hypothetical protein [Rhizobium sp. RU36D]SMD14962.1 hypothetical protein SAMN05880593_1272 [Rhizobium sp. RU36D]